jgi:DNA processing protein
MFVANTLKCRVPGGRMPLPLKTRSETLEDQAISPLLEMGAYEALWAKPSETFKTIADRFRAHPGALPSDFVPPTEALEFAKKARDIAGKAGVTGFGVRINGAGEYPGRLRHARHPIELLYFRGWWELAETRGVAIVGSREPSDEGTRRARRLAKLLVEDKFTVISGLAHGIDTAAHRAAMDAGGHTIAVIGTSLAEAYPRENADLQEEIAKSNLLISQIPFVRYKDSHWKAKRIFFPERNVTMSALSEATIIVEASNTSGTLTQARAALYQGRKLFILDNCFQNPDLTWPETYRRQGAIRVQDYEDIRVHLADTGATNR